MNSSLKNLNLSKKTGVIFGGILAIVIISAIMSSYSLYQASKSIDETEAFSKTIDKVFVVKKQVQALKSSIQAFVISGNLSYKEEYEKKSKELSETLSSTRNSAVFQEQIPPLLKQEFNEALGLFEQWQESIVKKQFQYAQNPYTYDSARIVEFSQKNQDIWHKINELFDKINAQSKELSSQNFATQKSMLWMAIISSIISTLLIAAACILSYVIISNSIVKPVKDIIANFVQMSKFDLTLQTMKVETQDEIGQLTESFNSLLESFKAIIGSVKNTTGQMAAASEEMSSTMQGIMQTMNAQNEASSQIAIAVQDSSKQSQEVNDLSISSQRNVTEMSDRAGEAVSSMNQLKENSDRIVSVLSVINDIADQVNLLALNAAIEAARAGDAGRGFAVVAEEVKKLANSVSKSTNEVQEEINNLQANVSKTGDSLSGITSSLETVHEESSKVTMAIEHQSSAIEEISASVDNFSQQVTTLSHALEEMEEVSQSIANEASGLDNEVAQFKV